MNSFFAFRSGENYFIKGNANFLKIGRESVRKKCLLAIHHPLPRGPSGLIFTVIGWNRDDITSTFCPSGEKALDLFMITKWWRLILFSASSMFQAWIMKSNVAQPLSCVSHTYVNTESHVTMNYGKTPPYLTSTEVGSLTNINYVNRMK